jgi:hypothetical protein
MSAQVDNRLAHRHLDLVLAGLRATPALDAEGMSRRELGRIGHPD